jgi:hypothetical protein
MDLLRFLFVLKSADTCLCIDHQCTQSEVEMPRKVFFSFHYERDIWRTNVVRNSGVVEEGSAAAGFYDASLWEETKKKGDAEVKK